MNIPELVNIQKTTIAPQTPETVSAIFDNVTRLIDHCQQLGNQVEYRVAFKNNSLTVEVLGSNER